MTKKEILDMMGIDPNDEQAIAQFYEDNPTPDAFMMKYGGMVEQYKKGGWIQKATASIKRRGTEGKCTPMSKPGCTGRALALAKTFHKMAAKRKKKEEGGYVDMYADGGKLPEGILRARLESHMSPDEAQDYINNYAQGGVVDVYQLMGMPTPSMYGMGGTTNIGDLSHVISRKNFPNMGYAMGGYVPMLKKGGFWNTMGDIGLGIGDVGLGAIGSVTGIKSMQDIIDEKQYSNDKFDDVTNTVGKVGGTALKVIPVTAPFAAAAGAVGGMANKTFGIDEKNYDPSKHTSDWDKAGNMIEGVGNMASMFTGNLGGAAGAAGAASKVGNISKGAQFANKVTQGANLANAGLSFGQGMNQGYMNPNALMSMYGNLQGLGAFAMGGQVNYPQGLRKNMGNMPIFAMGGMTGAPTEINVEKGELLVDPKTGKILTEYKGGGMVPHPEYGMDERGTVPAQEGMFVIPVKYKMGGMTYAERYKKAWKENDKDLMNALKNNTAYRKAKLEAKEEAEASKMMAKYGGAIQRMMARGGIVPMYDDGNTVVGPLQEAPYQFNMNNLFKGIPQQTPTPGGLPLPTPLQASFNTSQLFPNYLQPKQSTSSYTPPGGMYPNQTPYAREQGEDWGYTGSMQNPVTGFKDYLSTQKANTNAGFPLYARSGVNADGNPVSINPNMPSGYIPPGYEAKGGADMSNMNKYLPYALQAAPVFYNLAQGLRKSTKVPSTLGNMPTDLQAPKLLGDAGRRALARESALGRYAWRQAGAQAGPAALTAMTNARMARSADYEEKLRNAQAQMDYQAAAQRKAYQQFNAQQAMNRYMLQAQADAVPTQYMSSSMGQLGQMGENILNRQMLKELYG